MAAPAAKELPLDPKYDDYDYPTTAPTPQSGHPGHTTPEQDAQVHQLRAMLEQAGYTKNLDTLTLLRFLRARKFNVELSKQMFIDSEKWRASYAGVGVEELVRTFDYPERPQIFKYYPQYYHKTDKDGRPVYIEQLGNVDLTAMAKITSQERMIQNLVCEYEKMADPRLPACSRRSGYLLETSCSIMDLKGVGIAKATSVYGYLQAVSAISQNYYPERLGKMYVINAPWGFSGVWGVVKRFLDPVTVNKIHILGSGYQKELIAQVPAENLPKQFGGSCECPGGCALSDAGPWQDAQWAKPPKWAKKEDSKDVIDNTKIAPPTEGAGQQPLTGAGPEGVEPAAAPASAVNPNTANSA
ncbi:cytosolic factor, phosphatidylinositol/phosphatidylcholine transfer protein [Didymosphaeria variabile]|uniref:Cytosolic factor, phosphatidylinositol/phosphatidylcholine transfer protein n=1 Tax=Didymosphaeria variabile TaxID=1932322 RepID=A0A9W9C7R8_9PLEO|nr:cytosolic factor, phosphatidylinositol/phosphatidylcholine transfer protein [Didymosphaeria variabile]KAJ4348521.1 cytosolic factor, phosphatidylinositol/phosphatidylcholine transfer protein [Didymosphaeria variabile]